MFLIRAIIRPERSVVVMKALLDAGFPAVTKISAYGRGKQRGLRVGDVTYDELPKDILLMAISSKDKDFVVETIVSSARTSPSGHFGDGKIFVTPIEEIYTISSGKKEV